MSAVFPDGPGKGETVLYMNKLQRYGIREDMKHALVRYLVYGIKPGDFLTAVLENDFMEAFSRADDDNTRDMKQYAMILYNELPGGCYGTPEQVKEYAQKQGEWYARQAT